MAEEKKHLYEYAILGLPPLQMVLVHARNDAQNAAARKNERRAQASPTEPVITRQAVRKLIEHLQELENSE
jgi:hypothetical protein